MSTDINAERQQMKIREFMQLLPLTAAIAGLPEGEPGKYFSEGQMEVRAAQLRTAFKVAKAAIAEIIK